MTHAQAPSIVASHITRSYGDGPSRRAILQDLSLRFVPGELCLVMGASGSGKSTLLATLGGLLKPEQGEVRVFGTALWELPAEQLEAFRFRHFGFVFQGFNLFSALTACEQVALPLRFAGVAANLAQERALAALDEVGLTTQSGLLPAQLSGGEKQRVAIARALAGNPRVLFADEPTSSLDSVNSEIVIALLRRIAAQRAATVVVVTHDPRLRVHGQRLIELQDGSVLSDSSASQPPAHQRIAA